MIDRLTLVRNLDLNQDEYAFLWGASVFWNHASNGLMPFVQVLGLVGNPEKLAWNLLTEVSFIQGCVPTPSAEMVVVHTDTVLWKRGELRADKLFQMLALCGYVHHSYREEYVRSCKTR